MDAKMKWDWCLYRSLHGLHVGAEDTQRTDFGCVVV